MAARTIKPKTPVLHHIAMNLADIEQIQNAIDGQKEDLPIRPESYLAPQTPTEIRLAEIWAEMLHVDAVSASADFFELGGHSLLAIQILSCVNQAFGIEIPFNVIFQSKFTVAELATVIDRYRIRRAGRADLAAAVSKIKQMSESEIRSRLARKDGR
jgi:acyl carrier protein